MDTYLGDSMDVLKLQLALKKIGCFNGKCDGDLDSNNTKWAIRNFQKQCNMIANGLLDKATVEKLEKLIIWYNEQEKLAYTE